MLASALCQVAGKSAMPIYPGVEHPLLLQQQHQPTVPQTEALGRWPHRTTFPQGEAIEFLRQTIRTHPGEIVLLATGPMTNIALLFSLDPAIPSLLKGLVLMCGAFSAEQQRQTPVEWNALCDPHAAALVYRASPAQHRSIGLDVTMQVTMSAEQVRERFLSIPLLRPVLDFAEIWFRKRSQIVFHDPLAAVSIFDEQVCQWTRVEVEVSLQDDDFLGQTRWHTVASAAPHEIASTVDPAHFFDRYFSVF
jgi:inosine-uridine nucleoside N-ribohydrolase